ncbi:hypothetical protein Hanom_Chr12g01086401 [Helianthus anomalus]
MGNYGPMFDVRRAMLISGRSGRTIIGGAAVVVPEVAVVVPEVKKMMQMCCFFLLLNGVIFVY